MNQFAARPGAQPDFADLEIRIRPLQDEGYPVEITLNGEQDFSPGMLDASVGSWVPSGDLTADGQWLFNTLLADPTLRKAWDVAHGQAPRRRLRLRIDPAAAKLHALPWELMQEGDVLLSAQADTPFSRHLPVALPWSGPVEERPIRVLVVLSNPDDLEERDLAKVDVVLERETLTAALAGLGPEELRVEFLEPPATLERLEAALRGSGPAASGSHVLHYVGHGHFTPARNQAFLYLQDEEGSTDLVPDDALIGMLARSPARPRLVFLAACQSATRSTADAFAGLGPKLVRVGVPAVVAMQEAMLVETARKFSAAFYPRLLAHGLVDQAVNEARSTLLTAGRPDAAVPVLFMRLKSGQLWGAEADARGEVLGIGKPRAFWTTLVRQIERGRCTPIVGPRVHGGALPTLSEIAQRWADLHGYPFTNCSEMACVAQYMSTNQGEDFARYELLDTLKAELMARLPEEMRLDDGAETLTGLIQAIGWRNLVADNPNEVHRVLADLELPLYLTTNIDSFIIEALKARGWQPVRALCRWSEQLDRLGAPSSEAVDYVPAVDRPLVYHFLGSDEEVDSLVLTEDHFFTFLVRICAERDRIPYVIRDALSSTSLMFVGYSLHDWEFRVLMHGLVNNLSQRLKFNHVAVQLEPADREVAHTTAVQTFLQQYFRDAAINVYWGSPAQFAAELREHWQGRPR